MTLEFAISDTGIGIPKDRAGALFSPFVQADESTTRKYGGTGLGLAICKQLVEMMGGQIGFESEEGTGSTFRFTAVFEKQQTAAALADHEVANHAASVRGVKVLVLDDRASNRQVVSTLLTSWGYRATEAADATRRWRCFTRRPRTATRSQSRWWTRRCPMRTARSSRAGLRRTRV